MAYREIETKVPLDKVLNPSKPIVEMLSEQDRNNLSQCVFEEYAEDKDTRADWEAKNEEAMKIAAQIVGKKNYPWPGAANVKYPLIAGAAMQYAARAMPAIVSSNEIVRTKVVGRDDEQKSKAQRAARIKAHMNYQLTEEMTEWEEDMDSLLHGLPILGSFFKKSFFSPVLQRNVSELRWPQNVVVNNNSKLKIWDQPRVTDVFELTRNAILERQRTGLWIDTDLKLQTYASDSQGPFPCLEQHRLLDLDGDGYAEPYVVTTVGELAKTPEGEVTITPGTVVRIVPRFKQDGIKYTGGKVSRITPLSIWTKFDFLPDFLGKFLGTGFGALLLPINSSIDTVINQLLDAGTLSNQQAGFISKQLRIKGGNLSLEPGEWKQIDALTQDLRGAIVPIPVREPSAVLFSMLGLLIEAGKQLSSVSEVLSGEQSGVNVPATTTLALIEQGLKVFGAINKRIYRSLKNEFHILYRLNSTYLQDEQYFRVLDDEQSVARKDYSYGDCDVYPVADPNASTSTQKLIKAEALMKTMGMPGAMQPYDLLHMYYEALEIPDLEKLHPRPPENVPPPIEQQDIESKMKERQAKLPHEIAKLMAERKKMEAEALKVGTEAEAMDQQMSLEQMAQKMEMISQLMETMQAEKQAEADQKAQQMQMLQQLIAMQQQGEMGERQASQAGAEALAGRQEADAGRAHELQMMEADHGLQREGMEQQERISEKQRKSDS